MTAMDRFERNLTEWLHDDAALHRPDHLGQVLARTAATRQRPAWSSLERWLPVDITFRSSRLAVPGLSRALLVAILVLVIAAVAVIIGSHQVRRPAPFGTAGNGIQLASRGGDLYTIDPTSHAAKALVAGPDYDFGASWARDGSRFSFLRASQRPSTTGPASVRLMVADADGSNVRALFGPLDFGWTDWSPDGQRIAFLTTTGKRSIASIVDVATGHVTSLDVPGNPESIAWRPPDGRQLVFRSAGPQPGLFAIRADGTGLHQISTTPPLDQFDYGSPVVSPDGRSVLFARWYESTSQQRLFRLDIDTGVETAYAEPEGANQGGGEAFAPDGRTFAYPRIDVAAGTYTVVVVDTNDSTGEGHAIGVPMSRLNADLSLAFSPDGKAVIARYGTDDGATVWWLPVDGSAPVQLDSGEYELVDVQRVAP